MNCRTTAAYKLKTGLGFKQHGAMLTKKKSVLTKNSLFEEEHKKV